MFEISGTKKEEEKILQSNVKDSFQLSQYLLPY